MTALDSSKAVEVIPPNGSCKCFECGRFDLDHSEMSDPDTLPRPVCIKCVKQLLTGYVTCSECDGSGGGTKINDILRGPRTEWCIGCDGDGRVFVGVPARLQGRNFDFLENGDHP